MTPPDRFFLRLVVEPRFRTSSRINLQIFERLVGDSETIA
jgi:hypothetical protein